MRPNILLTSNQIRGVDGTGGLGDVPVGLAKVLLARGDVDIRLAMPGFAEITMDTLEDRFRDEHLVRENLPVPFGSDVLPVNVYEIALPNAEPPVTVYLFRCPSVFDLVDPETGRVNKNTPDKAILFSRAVVEFLRAYEPFRVDLVHCNDWHSGLVPVYLNTIYRNDLYLGRIATLFTSHNAGGDAYQGGFPEERKLLHWAGLSDAGVFQGGITRSLFHNDKFNFLKGGVGFADVFNTVSRQYRQELMTPAFAGGLEGVFQERAHDFTGIVNGIDTAEWDPACDPVLQQWRFSPEEPLEAIREKKRQIRGLLREWQIPDPRHPCADRQPYASLQDESILVGVVSRLDYQKFPILRRALDRILDTENVQLAVLGSADRNDPLGRQYEDELREKAETAPEKLLFFDGFNIPLSHLIYAASEMFLVPSTFEPCGLTQLVAMRYGSVPLVRSTGGLVDTVIDEADPVRGPSATGFCFKEPVVPVRMMDQDTGADALVVRFRQATQLYSNQPQRWNELIRNGLARDSSWTIPGTQYFKLYHEAIRRSLPRAFFV